MNLNELTASKIKEIRKNLGFTVEAVAKDLGISKTAYSQMENGHIEITLTRIEAIAKVYNIPIAEIVPSANNNTQVSHGSGDNYNSYSSTNHTINNNFFADTEERLKHIAENLNTAINEIRESKK